MTHASNRLPRFSRGDTSPNFSITERDVEILREIARHRFIRSTHISQLVAGSHKKICERLTYLFHAGYVDRPPAQLDYHVRGGGSTPIIYALGNRGARLLNEHEPIVRNCTNWSKKNRDAGREFILHTLAITDFDVGLVRSCKLHRELTLLDQDRLRSSAPVEADRETLWRWRVTVHYRGMSKQIGILPDYVFAIMLADGRRRPFVVECDRGTMPVARNSLDQTSMLRKFLAYEAARSQRLPETHCGWKNFRVLVVTSSIERIAHMQTVINQQPQLRSSPL